MQTSPLHMATIVKAFLPTPTPRIAPASPNAPATLVAAPANVAGIGAAIPMQSSPLHMTAIVKAFLPALTPPISDLCLAR